METVNHCHAGLLCQGASVFNCTNLPCKSRAWFWAHLPAVIALPWELCLQKSRAGTRDRGASASNIKYLGLILLWSYVATPLLRWTEITVYTSWDLSHLHSGQVLQWGWGLDILPTCCGDLFGLGGPVAQTKLNFSVFGVFLLLGCSEGIAQPFHSIPMSRQINGVVCSLFFLHKKSFLRRRLSLSDTLGSALLFFPCHLPYK